MARDTGGVGLQLNPTMIYDLGWDALARVEYDFAELLCDMFAGPLETGYVIDPATRPVLERLQGAGPLIAHGNYGNEFGFDPLPETPAVLRHIPIAHAMDSPWYADHMFYGSRASAYLWSTPLQFSHAEVDRVAGRAAALQDGLKKPLLHENAFYYAAFPGSELPEAEFMANVAEKAATHLLLDLHNVYSNSLNFPGYDCWRYLRTIPLDRVIEIHLAGGQWLEGWYHDLHNSPVPAPVWDMLEYVLARGRNVRAVCLEVQGPAHTPRSLPVQPEWVDMINRDLGRARQIWSQVRKATAS